MADQHDHSPKPTRAAPPPFMGPPRGGALAPKTRIDRPTLPPFSPPFVKRPTPVVRPAREDPARVKSTEASPPSGSAPAAPAWLEGPPNESPPALSAVPEVGIAWIDPDQPAVAAPPQAATGIEWLDSPVPERATSAPSAPPASDDDDVFGWDPAEDRDGALDSAPVSETLDALKEVEPWALPGAEPSASTSRDVASALERVAARVRSGDLFVPGASTAASEEAVLAAVLAALLQRARG